MTEINPDYIALDAEMSERELDPSPVSLLEKIKHDGRVWDDLCEQYGVDNPDPPWRITLEATCEILAEESCRVANSDEEEAAPSTEDSSKGLDPLERRWEEDQLVKQHYAEIPFPENQLLALAHTLIRRGLLSEDELARKMSEVDDRLHMA